MTSVDIGPASGGCQNKRTNRAFAGSDFVLSGSSIKFLFLTLGALLVVRLVSMVTVPFTDTTEARYAEIARKMVETGNWLTPQFDYGVPFWGKPPLHTWLSAGGMELMGINEFAARFPILLTSLAVLLLLYIWVAGIAGRNTALLSVVVLASMGLFFGASAFVMTDMPMVLGTTLVMVSFWNGVCRGPSSTFWGLALFFGLAIGLLAKGPVAVVLGVIPIVIWLAITRNWSLAARLPWLKGTTLMLALTAPWYIAAEIATPGFLRYFIVGEHFERFVVSGWKGDLYGVGHARAKGMIWLYWLGTMLPWTVIPAAFLFRARKVSSIIRNDDSGWLAYLLLWVASPLFLFTLAANILPAYTLPGLPAAAVLIVVLAGAVWSRDPGIPMKSVLVASVATTLGLFSVVALLAQFSPETLNLKTQRELVAAVRVEAENAPIYMVGGRSFAGEFYTGGKARVVALRDVPSLATSQDQAAFSVPETLAAQVATLNVRRIGKFGRRVLFINDGAGK
jgi:4-amino-4-deoxy-L-arabinose transferase-like glycosyltransferase